MHATATTPDIAAVKQAQQRTWATGDYASIATKIQFAADRLCESADLDAGARVLDVACGTGNATIAAARFDCDVVGVDYVPELLERAAVRAEAEGLPVELREGDAEALPFGDESFDAVLSVYGAMFAPDQQRTADELLRVCRPGGTIAMANWTPDGFAGQMFKLVGSYAPPPDGVPSPVLWGTEPHVRKLFGDGVTELRCTEQTVAMRHRSAEEYVDFFRTRFGPVIRAFGAIDEEQRAALRADLVQLVGRFARVAPSGAVAVESSYLEVIATRA